ncbi:MAG: hypothetical protein WD407_04460 [Rhodospirillales bacterium]
MERLVGSKLRRRENWPEALDVYLRDADRRAFSWESDNCVLFGAGGIAAMTGADVVTPIWGPRARWPKTKRGVLARLKRVAGDVELLVTRVLGAPLAAPLKAQRGDVALGAVRTLDGDVSEGVGIVLGARVVFMTEAGLGTLPLRHSRLAWRV